MTEPADLGEVLEFMRLVWSVDSGLQSASKRMERELGVTGPQRLVVRLLARFPGLSPGDLARLMHLHPSTLTGVLRRMQDRGLVVQESDATDRRRRIVRLTAAGMRINATREGTVEATVESVLHTQPAERVIAARALLAELAAALAPAPTTPRGSRRSAGRTGSSSPRARRRPPATRSR